MTIWNKTRSHYERNEQRPDHLYKWHLCPWCGRMVIPLPDSNHKGFCAAHGNVTYVTMLETLAPLFKAQVEAMQA